MEKKPLVIIAGPTAVGKTDLSVKLAKAINGEIVSADSIQVYKKLDIGSAKVTDEEKCGIAHYMIDELEPDEDFNIFLFKEMAQKYIEEIYAKGKIPIIAGGTGFYIQALLYDIEFSENEDDKTIRTKLEELAKEHGADYMHDMLDKVDPESAEGIHKNNLKRVIRALEYYEQTGEKISLHNSTQRQNVSPYNFAYFVLNKERKVLYELINLRVDIMLGNGLVDEVKSLKNQGYGRSNLSMQGIGYKEILDYIEGNVSLEQAVYNLKKDSRNFAKRQLTWFRREKETMFLNYEDFDNDKNNIVNEMINILKDKKIIEQ